MNVDPPADRETVSSTDVSDAERIASSEIANTIDHARKRLSELMSHRTSKLDDKIADPVAELITTLETLITVNQEHQAQYTQLITTQQLLDSERQRYRELFNSAPDGYLITDPQGTILEANWTAAAMLNVAERFLRKKTLAGFTGKEDHRKLRSLLNELKKVDRKSELEIDIYPVDAPPFLAHLTVAASRDDSGQPSVLRWLVRDITPRRQAEIRLQREKQNRELAEQGEIRFRMLAENVPQLVWIASSNGKTEYLNSQWYQYTGLSPTEPPADITWFSIHPDDHPAATKAWTDALRKGRVFEIEFRIMRHDGVYRWFLARGTPLKDQDGHIVKMFGTCTDIHEQREARQALEQQWIALENIHDALIITNPDSLIQDCNNGFTEMFGYTKEEALGRPIGMLQAPDEYATLRPQVMQILQEIGRWSGEMKYFRKDKTAGICETNIVPIRNDRGEIVALVGTCRDITEQKRATAEIAELYAKEHRIAESLQRSLLAKPARTEFATLDIETVYQPALDEAQVGGDYYDFFTLEGGRVALVVGDVSGKGLHAASRTAEVKFSLRAYLREDHNAATALTRLNNCLCESQRLDSGIEDYFVCLALAVMHSDTGVTEISVAGSNPPLIIRRDLTVDVIEASGMPLGIEPGTHYHSATAVLEHDDLLLIATDGIIEARRGKEFLDVEGVAELARDAAPLGDLERIGQTILHGVGEFTGGKFHDDVCMLLARRG